MGPYVIGPHAYIPKRTPYTCAVNRLVRNHWALFTILLVGSCCRIYQLGTESLWLDEGASLGFAYIGGPSEIVEQSKTDNNFPTYYLILYYWIALFGESDLSVRVPSALAGIVAIFVIYKLGYLLFSRNVGIIASLDFGALSFSCLLITGGQN